MSPKSPPAALQKFSPPSYFFSGDHPASTDLHTGFPLGVIGAMDSSADLSAQILNNTGLSQKLLAELAPISQTELSMQGRPSPGDLSLYPARPMGS